MFKRTKTYHRIIASMLILGIMFSNGYIVKALSAADMDLNSDGVVDMQDLQIIREHTSSYNSKYDLNKDSKVDIYDLSLLSNYLESKYQNNNYSALSNTFSNLINSSFSVKKDNTVYYRNTEDGGRLYKANLNRESKTRLTDEPVSCINIFGDTIYYLNLSDNGKIYSMKIDGTGRKLVVSDNNNNFILNGDTIFYRSSSDNQKLYKVKIDGSGKSKVTDDSLELFISTPNEVFYANKSDSGRVYKIKHDGSGKTRITTDAVSNFVIENGNIYYINKSDGNKVYKISTLGLERTMVINDNIVNLNVSNEWIYYNNSSDGRLSKIKNDGTNKSYIGGEILPKNPGENRISVIDNWIYYINANDGNRLYRIKADGSNKREVDSYIKGKVNTTWLSFRSEPVVSTSTFIASIPYGTEVEIISSVNAPALWYKVNYKLNGVIRTGYVSAAYVLVINDDRLENMLGVLSAQYESNGDPGVISDNPGDSGGKSYGTWQLAKNTGSLNSFLLWLRNVNLDFYNQLIDGKNKDGGDYGTNFDSVWKRLASLYRDDFLYIQHSYIRYAYYDSAAGRLSSEMGINASSKSFSFKNVVWSTAVQHGVTGAMNVIKASGTNNLDTDSTFIEKVYNERSKVDVYFSKNSQSVRDNVYKRFQSEKADAQKTLEYELQN